LTPRQLAAARLLALGRSIPQVAAELKVARTTIWRWQTHSGFRAELEHLHLWLAGVRIGRC
jgi:DNA-binding NarL/FixJ family response regulator